MRKRAANRVKILQYAIRSIKYGKLLPVAECKIASKRAIKTTNYAGTEKLDKIFKKSKVISAPIIGILFVAAVRTFKDFKIGNLENKKEIQTQDIHKYLLKFFDANQLQMIELAFERHNWEYLPDNEKEDRVFNFADHIKNDQKRALFILRAILSGKFPR